MVEWSIELGEYEGLIKAGVHGLRIITGLGDGD